MKMSVEQQDLLLRNLDYISKIVNNWSRAYPYLADNFELAGLPTAINAIFEWDFNRCPIEKFISIKLRSKFCNILRDQDKCSKYTNNLEEIIIIDNNNNNNDAYQFLRSFLIRDLHKIILDECYINNRTDTEIANIVHYHPTYISEQHRLIKRILKEKIIKSNNFVA